MLVAVGERTVVVIDDPDAILVVLVVDIEARGCLEALGIIDGGVGLGDPLVADAGIEESDSGNVGVDFVVVLGHAGFEHETHLFSDDFLVSLTYICEYSADDPFDGLRGDVDLDAVHEVDICCLHAVAINLRDPLFEHLHALLVEASELLLQVIVGLDEFRSRMLRLFDDAAAVLWRLVRDGR